MKPYDFAVFIGRFQPFHRGHAEVIEHGFRIANEVIVLVGSSNRPRSLRNPFTFDERRSMIEDWFKYPSKTCDADFTDLNIRALPDAAYDDLEWVRHVQEAVRNYTSMHVAPRIALIGSDKDNSTYYLRLFPQWSFEGIQQAETLNATAVRDTYFEGGVALLTQDGYGEWLHPSTIDYLSKWQTWEDYAALKGEAEFITEYRRQWGTGPFMAVDAAVICSGHILLIERGRPPGVGKLAMPGGFLDAGETLLQGALRELQEETGLVIGIEEAAYLLKAREVFDDPYRSARARMITTAHLFELPPGRLPAVQGGDDAAVARWVPLADLRTDNMFADHAFIIRNLLKKGS